MLEDEKPFWAVVEIMGKRQIAGRVTKFVESGTTILRVDVPDPENREKFIRTIYFNIAAQFALNVTDEEIARAAATSHRYEAEWEYSVEVFLKRMTDRLRGEQEQLPFDDDGNTVAAHPYQR